MRTQLQDGNVRRRRDHCLAPGEELSGVAAVDLPLPGPGVSQQRPSGLQVVECYQPSGHNCN